MKLYAIILEICFVLMLVQFAHAQILPENCSEFLDWKQTECENILLEASLSLVEKQDLFLNLIESQSALPSHEFVWNWNNEIEFNEAPLGVEDFNNGILRNAWLKIITVNKSVFDVNSLQWFVEPNGKILTEYNFEIELPFGTASGDCRTNYSYELLNEDLETKLNDFLIGSEKVSEFVSDAVNNDDLLFSSVLKLKARLRTDHFTNQKVCRRNYFDFRLREWRYYCRYECRFHHTEYRVDELNLSDNFTAKVKVIDFNVLTGFKENLGFNEFNLNVDASEELNEFQLSLEDNVFSFSEVNFDLNSMLEPYGVLFVTRNKNFSFYRNNFIELNSDFEEKLFQFATNENSNCELKVVTDFEEIDLSPTCLNPLKETQLFISTDKNSYDFNELIYLTGKLTDLRGSPLANKKIKLFYGNSVEELITDLRGEFESEILANESFGSVTVKFDSLFEFASSREFVHFSLSNSGNWNSASEVGVFAGIYYLLFLVTKKCFGVCL